MSFSSIEKDLALLNVDVPRNTDASGKVLQPRVINTGRYIGNAKSLVGTDRTILGASKNSCFS